MLNNEEATARLRSLQQPRWREDTLSRGEELGRKLRPLVVAVLEAYGPGERERRTSALTEAAQTIEQLSDKDRNRLMRALHPQLGDVLSRWWVDARSQPYLTGWGRRAFRAPANANLTLKHRGHALAVIIAYTGRYPFDATWLAAWSPFLAQPDGVYVGGFVDGYAGPLLAAAIDAGGSDGDSVLRTLIEVGNGEHSIGMMGNHVIVALLRSSRVEGWEFVERLLLAAQRQEGLRQAILEAVDEAHPAAFTRMLDVVLEQNLLRFAAAVRAVATWIGFPADVTEIADITSRVSDLRRYRIDPDACRTALATGSAWETYLALCSVAMHDVMQAIRWADSVLEGRSVDARAAAVRFLATTYLTNSRARLLELVDDPSLDVATLAFSHLPRYASEEKAPGGAFVRLERLAQRLPDGERSGELVGIETVPPTLARQGVVAQMLRVRGRRPLSEMLRWVPDMDTSTRSALAIAAGEAGLLTADVRRVLVAMVGDRSADVRDNAVTAMDKLGVNAAEAPELEALLTRKAGDLRRGVIRLLSKQRVNDAVDSARRLWDAGDAPRRDAACELLGAIPGQPPAVRGLAASFVEDGPTQQQLDLLRTAAGAAVDDAASGLAIATGLTNRTPPRRPRRAGRSEGAPSLVAPAIVSALDDLAHAHRDTRLTVYNWQGSTEILLADVRWLPSPFYQFRGDSENENEDRGLVLPHVFRRWWDNRPTSCRSGSAHDALDAFAALSAADPGTRSYIRRAEWWSFILQSVAGGGVGEMRHRPVVDHVLEWLLFEEADASSVDVCLSRLEAAMAAIPADVIARTARESDETTLGSFVDWRYETSANPWESVLNGLLATRPELFGADHLRRWLGLSRWREEPVIGARRISPHGSVVLAASRVGAATDDDVRDAFLAHGSSLFTEFTRRRRRALEREHSGAIALADELRARVLEVERTRGELATAVSAVALRLGSIEGAALTMDLLGRLGRASLVRRAGRSEGRESVYSHLLRVSYPSPSDDASSVTAAAKSAKVSDKRLIELAVFAPQWARVIGEALDWDGFEDAVWWFHAHTKDDQWTVDREVRESWAALSAERTPLSGMDLVAGAVDFAWFHRAHSTLGGQRWNALHAAAKLASGSSGHRRAQLFSEAMLGMVGEDTLLSRVVSTRHQDSVRALGLVPLTSEPVERGAVTLRRYLVLRNFERGAAKFGSQRQASERAAVLIGIENLARSAGFVDPQRFIWAMEAAEAGDLSDGSATATEGDVVVTLQVDEHGQADLLASKGGRPLKTIPAALRKSPEIAKLRDRKTALVRQASRVRASLESAMVREERFTNDDLTQLDRHPVVAPMLKLLVFVDGSGRTMRRSGDGFVAVDGEAVVPADDVRLAHPIDLLRSGDWLRWQERLFVNAQRQPFKQAFRELYVLTDTERAGGPGSRRYDGHQIQPRQAMALFGRRGWLADRDGGDVSRVFHQHGYVARVEFLGGFLTPAEVELPTLNSVHFTRQGEHLAQPIDSIPGVVFSEAMRDLDLVVSVAHAGGVDPETTASTIDMRAALARETIRLARLDNVRFVDSHVIIDGSLGEYSLHLGSGVVHRRPGGAICIIPVDSQRRGRLFLPFADDDPKTAEVIAKMLLLAHDSQIKDPSILSQLRS